MKEKKDKILKVPLPGCIKFKKIFDDNEYLQKVLEEDRTSISIWFINDGCDMRYLVDVLNKNRIKHQIIDE